MSELHDLTKGLVYHGTNQQPTASLTAVDGGFALKSPKHFGLIDDLKARISSDSRRWDPLHNRWLIAPQYAQIVADLCRKHLGVTVTIPAATAIKAVPTVKLLKMEYIGVSKDRGGDKRSSYGWVDGGWNAVFPERVLREWFEGDLGVVERPDAARSLYQQLTVKPDATEQEVRSAYRRLAKMWHPDVATGEPDAAQVFKQIQGAYAILSDPVKRRKYDAGLALEATIRTVPATYDRSRAHNYTMDGGYRPLLRCGWILCECVESLGRFSVSRILQWEDVTNQHGQTLVTSWPLGAKMFAERWV